MAKKDKGGEDNTPANVPTNHVFMVRRVGKTSTFCIDCSCGWSETVTNTTEESAKERGRNHANQ